ncbi:hypothetical protein MMG00_08090 [Ignatzschineria rhizosphaerae]|uniref:Lipoprotein n=1 Tax=Ignatzschineria rhizosphaerae TaxID=2923279 RepID=A0ABY3WX64_9GAMM|nr:hypothetical protein [Ignatzschineria rhizosphaerae]UNM95189.1 hypothetical protein MMG00_08090 [Ignatzschineria rhizosphaerae]
MRKLLILLFALVITACSDSYDNYVGYWSQEDKSDIVTITKEDSKTYLLVRNRLASGEKEEFVLEKNANGYFEITIAFFGVGKLPVILSEDGATLRLDNKVYKKIDSSKAKETIQNTTACKQLSSSYLDERQEINYRDEARRSALKETYIVKQQSIPDCDIGSYIFSF